MDDFANDAYDPVSQSLGSAEEKMLSSAGSAYTYKPLNIAQSFRVLILLSSSHWDDCIECTLQHVSAEEVPHYIAHSYVWGDPSIRCSVIVNGVNHRVTSNLGVAIATFASTKWGTPCTY